MGICIECRHHRPARPVSQVLASDFADTAADVSQALAKVAEEEQKQLEAEAGYLRQVAASGGTEWAMPPAMSGWCGLQEDRGRYLIAEVRNAGGSCTDFQPTAAERPDCTTCRHRVVAREPEEDRRRESVYVEITRRNISAGVTADTTASLLDSHRRAVTARQALEITGLQQGGGTLPAVPGYVDHCAALSVPGRYVACRIENRYRTCPSHDPVEAPAAVEEETPSATAAPVLVDEMADAYLELLVFVDALGRDRPWRPPSRELRDRFASQLTAAYPGMTSEQQVWLTSLPQGWADLRLRWSRATPADRRDLARALVRTFWGAGPRRSTPEASMAAIFARQAQEEAELERVDPEQAVQLMLQNQVGRAAMRSNAMKLRHQAQMSIIENMK